MPPLHFPEERAAEITRSNPVLNPEEKSCCWRVEGIKNSPGKAGGGKLESEELGEK